MRATGDQLDDFLLADGPLLRILLRSATLDHLCDLRLDLHSHVEINARHLTLLSLMSSFEKFLSIVQCQLDWDLFRLDVRLVRVEARIETFLWLPRTTPCLIS